MSVLLTLLLLGCAEEGAGKTPVPAEITCPSGTQQKGALPPEGRMLWCETPDGTRHGPWVSAWDDGSDKHGPTRASEGRYQDGVLKGPFTSWFQGGHTVAVVYDQPGGKALVSDELGKKLYTVDYRDDAIDSCPEGATAKEEAMARWCELPGANGDEAKKHGRLQTQYSRGHLESQMYYVDGKLHGPFIAFHDDKSIWLEGEYVDGKRHGHWMTWAKGEHTR